MAAASKNLGDCFHDLYEPEWAGQADVSQLLSVSHNFCIRTIYLTKRCTTPQYITLNWRYASLNAHYCTMH
jgi:hypothetical protein